VSIFRELAWDRFMREADAFDMAVLSTPDIDHFCSSSAWICAARHAFMPQAEPLVLHCRHGYVAMIRERKTALGTVLLPMEASWCLPSSLVGPNPAMLVRPLFHYLREHEDGWDAILFAGIMEGSALYFYLPRIFAARYRIFRGPNVSRRIAGIGDGRAGFLRRRSAKFRKNLRRAEAAGQAVDLSFTHYSDAMEESGWSELFERVMAIEGKSWKGLEDQGVDQEPMRTFYRELMRLQAPRGRIRALLAHLGGRDVGYILGGVLTDFFRGYQFSYDAHYRHLSLGNLLQMRMIEGLAAEGVGYYDLGTDIPYKSRWGEIESETVSLIVRK